MTGPSSNGAAPPLPPSGPPPAGGASTFLVQAGRGLPQGVRAAPRLHKRTYLKLSPDETDATGEVANLVHQIAAILGIGLAVGLGITLATGVAAPPGSAAWLFMFFGKVGMIAGVVVILSSVLLSRLFVRTLTMRADPGIHRARFRPRSGTVCLELDDGRWTALRLAGPHRDNKNELQAKLQAFYGDRLTVED